MKRRIDIHPIVVIASLQLPSPSDHLPLGMASSQAILGAGIAASADWWDDSVGCIDVDALTEDNVDDLRGQAEESVGDIVRARVIRCKGRDKLSILTSCSDIST